MFSWLLSISKVWDTLSIPSSRDRCNRSTTFAIVLQATRSCQNYNFSEAQFGRLLRICTPFGLINDLGFVLLKFVNRICWRADIGATVVLVKPHLIIEKRGFVFWVFLYQRTLKQNPNFLICFHPTYTSFQDLFSNTILMPCRPLDLFIFSFPYTLYVSPCSTFKTWTDLAIRSRGRFCHLQVLNLLVTVHVIKITSLTKIFWVFFWFCPCS